MRLPAPRAGRGGGAPRRLGTAVPVPSGVPSEAGALHDLCLVPVTGEADRRIGVSSARTEKVQWFDSESGIVI